MAEIIEVGDLPFTISFVGDGVHDLFATQPAGANLRHVNFDMQCILENTDGDTYRLSILANADPFIPDNDFHGEYNSPIGLISWDGSWEDDGGFSITVSCEEDNPLTCHPFDGTNGFSAHWDGTADDAEWDPLPKINDVALDPSVYSVDYFSVSEGTSSGSSGSTWIQTLNLNLLAQPDENVDGSGDGTNATDGLTVRAWGFSLDDHEFYVLRLGDSTTLVYDLTTQRWSEWISPGRTAWRAHIGQNWVGCQRFDPGNTDVIAGDDGEGIIYQLSTTNGRDQRTDVSLGEDDKITKVVVGGVQAVSRNTIPCGAVTLDLAMGNTTQDGATIKLEISDDAGHTWQDCGSIQVDDDDFSSVVEWRGLGTIKAPGRLFRFTDDGATTRINGANMR